MVRLSVGHDVDIDNELASDAVNDDAHDVVIFVV